MKDQELRSRVTILEHQITGLAAEIRGTGQYSERIWTMLTDLMTQLGYQYEWERAKPAGWKVTKREL